MIEKYKYRNFRFRLQMFVLKLCLSSLKVELHWYVNSSQCGTVTCLWHETHFLRLVL